MIAIDQSGQQSPKAIMSKNGSRIEALQKPYPGGGVAVLLANLGSSAAAGEFTLAAFGISSRTATLFNIWTGKTQKMDHLGYWLGAGKTALLRLR